MTAKADTNPLREALERAIAFYDGLDGPHAPGEAKLLDSLSAALASEPVAGTEREALITAELEELASNFEGAGGMWHGASIATALRERIKNHHFYEGTALPPQGGGAWQCISTAPRDGTPFLCFHHCDVFSPQTGIDLIWYEPGIKTYTMDGDTEVPFAGVTHWQPLPAPPTLPRADGGAK